MNPVILERLAELVGGNVSKALMQVAHEIRELEKYCIENKVSIPSAKLKAAHLRDMKC